jgi:hypothetical protein
MRPVRPKRGTTQQAQATQKLGRSRGGLTSKLHLLCEGRCRPLSLGLSAGQVHDSDEATIAAVLDGVRVPRPGGKGRPRKRPARVLGDKGYSYKNTRSAAACCASVGSP